MLPIFHTKRLREAVGGPPTAGMWQNHWRAWGLAHMSGPAVGHLPSVPGLVSVLPKVAPPATFSRIRAGAGFQSPCPQHIGWHLARCGCWVSQVSCRWGSLHCTASLKRQPTYAPLALNFFPPFTQSHPFVHIYASAQMHYLVYCS